MNSFFIYIIGMIGIVEVVKSFHLWWADSRGKVIVVLLALWLVSLVNHFQVSLAINVLLAVIASSLLNPSLSSVVTGLLIGLIFDPTAGFCRCWLPVYWQD